MARLTQRRPFQSDPICIHPSQGEPVNAVFSPTEAEVAFAIRVVTAFHEAEAQGLASIQLDGRCIDYPIVESAQRILATAEAIRHKTTAHGA